jgi:hypothetical protein
MNLVFDMAQNEMILILRNSTMQDIVNKKELFFSYFELLESMQNLLEMKEKHYPNNTLIEMESLPEEDRSFLVSEVTNELTNNQLMTENSEAIVSEQSLIDKQLRDGGNSTVERPKYLFERKLRGGVITKISAYIPEGVVRKLSIEHGDYIYAEEAGVMEDGHRKKYLYELAEKTLIPVSCDRVQLNFCEVKKDGNIVVVSNFYENGVSQNFRFNDVPYSITLNDSDITEFKLGEGDLIDIAFQKDRPDLAKVIYVHPTSSIGLLDRTIKQASVKKIAKEIKTVEPIDQTLTDKTILVVGNEPDKSSYKKQIEDRGGIFLWADAKDHFVTFQSLVRKCDCVVFLLGVSGHTGMKQIKQLCKDYEVPFQTTFTEGITTVVRLAEAGTA